MDDSAYEASARTELEAWLKRMSKPPSRLDDAAREFQTRVNAIIPEAAHAAMTAAIEAMTRGMLAGSDFIAPPALTGAPLSEREALARRRIGLYRSAGAAEGGVAGAGGFMLSLAEFPVFMATKIKLLSDVAAAYGCDGGELDERLFILSIFQLAFSGAEHRRAVLSAMTDWDARAGQRPASLDAIDWRRFQQEYRDNIDLVKMAQLIPGVGAPAGALVNWSLIGRLGETAVNAYRMRWFAREAAA
jgi:hypothetical protein